MYTCIYIYIYMYLSWQLIPGRLMERLELRMGLRRLNATRYCISRVFACCDSRSLPYPVARYGIHIYIYIYYNVDC